MTDFCNCTGKCPMTPATNLSMPLLPDCGPVACAKPAVKFSYQKDSRTYRMSPG